jgi:hypothetical protein
MEWLNGSVSQFLASFKIAEERNKTERDFADSVL